VFEKNILLMIIRWVYTRSFAVDGNFTASHQRQKCPEDDVPLTNGQAFMTESSEYKEHLKIALESKPVRCTCNEFRADRNVRLAGYDATGIGAVACLRHGFFQPEATVDFQKGEQYVAFHRVFALPFFSHHLYQTEKHRLRHL
jgi:hypothetical protein